MLGITQDISKNKQLESQLVHAHKMEAVGQLTGGIAHDFNNILTAVLGYSYMMEETLQKQGDETLQRYLKPDLLIIDDMGMKQLPKRSGEYLFEIIMRRYELRSTVMTSNRPLEDWGKLIGDTPSANRWSLLKRQIMSRKGMLGVFFEEFATMMILLIRVLK